MMTEVHIEKHGQFPGMQFFNQAMSSNYLQQAR
jgi:hypothetical protein